jgi:hypothetical protein
MLAGMPITVVPYSDEWPTRFAEVAVDLACTQEVLAESDLTAAEKDAIFRLNTGT